MSVPNDNEGLRLHVDAIQAGYGPVTIIRDMTLRLQTGTITALLGPNGAGKSTTCKAIVGLIPTIEGRILLNGVDLSARPCWWRAQQGVFLAPEGRGIFPGLSVDDNLKVSVRRGSDRERIYERFSNLADRRRLSAGSLSGGEQQMLAVARAMMMSAPRLRVRSGSFPRAQRGWCDDPAGWGEPAWARRYRRCGNSRSWWSSGVVG